MKDIININRIPTVDHLNRFKAGKFRHVVKVRAGFISVVDARPTENERYLQHPESTINGYKKGALQSVEFCPEGSDYYFTVFARAGKRIALIDQAILENLKVGTINSMFINTQLYDQRQYAAVNAKTWDSYAYVMNETAQEA